MQNKIQNKNLPYIHFLLFILIVINSLGCGNKEEKESICKFMNLKSDHSGSEGNVITHYTEHPLFKEMMYRCNLHSILQQNETSAKYGFTEEQTIVQGKEVDRIKDPFKLTDDCYNAMKAAISVNQSTFSDSENPEFAEENKREGFRGIHGLFFSPLYKSQNKTILNLNIDGVLSGPLSEGIPSIYSFLQDNYEAGPLFNDFPDSIKEIKNNTKNLNMIEYFCSTVKEIKYKEDSIFAAQFINNKLFFTQNLKLNGEGLLSGRINMSYIMYHEITHHFGGHTTCLDSEIPENIQSNGTEDACDLKEEMTYQSGASAMNALAIGAMMSEIKQTGYSPAQLLPDEVIEDLFFQSCRVMETRLNVLRTTEVNCTEHAEYQMGFLSLLKSIMLNGTMSPDAGDTVSPLALHTKKLSPEELSISIRNYRNSKNEKIHKLIKEGNKDIINLNLH